MTRLFLDWDCCGLCKEKFRLGAPGTREGRCKKHAGIPVLWGIRHRDGSVQQKFKHMHGPENNIRVVSGSCAWPSKKEAKRHKQAKSDKVVRVKIVEVYP